MSGFAERLLAWFDDHGRKDLPWQTGPAPYRVWVSEIMLQQTQVATVIPYFQRFMESFPDVIALADAPRDDVLHHWSGLGYYARARNLHDAAVIVRDDFAGVFPTAFDDVVTLPGIGRSTAGAILALSMDQRHAILDGNVKRVLARYHTVAGWPGQTAVAKELWDYAERHTPIGRIADYTQAIMDLGATLCTRSKPGCGVCPMQEGCRAHAAGSQADFPGKKPRKEKPTRSTVMVLARTDGALYLERRPSAGIWGGLWSLPEIGGREALTEWCAKRLNAEPVEVTDWSILKHSFSHYDLDILPLEVRLTTPSRRVSDSDNELWYALEDPPGVGLAAPVKSLIERLNAQRPD